MYRCTDFSGNVYESMTAMAHRYGLSHVTVNYRLKAGWTLKQALTMPLYTSAKKRAKKC